MSPCHPFRPVPGQCGPNRRGPLPAPPFDPRDYWATRKCVSRLSASLGTKLDKVDVVDPGAATEAGKAADAKSTYEELGRIIAKLAEKADKATTLAGYGITDAATKTEIAAKADLVDGKVPAAQLPSYVDDVLEYDTMSAFPATGESGKIYVAKDANKTYRWSGTQYVEISPSPVLDDTVTEGSANGVKSSGIWSWVKSLLPNWLTSDYAEPATVESVATKADKTALDDKRDKDDLAVYEVVRTENTDWTWTGENAEIVEALNNAHSKPYHAGVSDREAWADIDPFPFDLSEYSTSGIEDADLSATSLWYKLRDMASFEEITVYATRPRYMDESIGTKKQNQHLAAVATGDAQTPANGDLLKYDAANNRLAKAVAGVDFRDPQDNTCRKTELGEWVADLPAGYTFEQESTIHYDGNNSWSVIVRIEGFGPSTASATGPEDSTSLNFRTTFGSTFTATRTAVCSDGKRFVTEDFAAKKSDIFGNDGNPSDMFTANLLGKPVANIKANSSAFAPEYYATSAYSVGAIVYYDGNIYQCKTAIAAGGEAWNAEHWELRKLYDFFTESNSLLTDLIAIKTSGKADQSNLDALAAKVDTANAALEEVA